MTNTARVLISQAPREGAKITVTVEGEAGSDMRRVLKVLGHILSEPQEWDDEIPNVELVFQKEIEADA